LRETRKRVGVNSFTKLKTIGHGAFGVVSLVREKETGQYVFSHFSISSPPSANTDSVFLVFAECSP
jgi:hypothetical protein